MKCLLFFLILLTPLAAKVFSPETATLKNGLQIIVVHNSIAPVISTGVIIKVGTADDPSHITGLSHFLEHMMFKGTKEVPGQEFSRIITRKGGYSNAHTSFDRTVYVVAIAKEHLELVLKLEADRLHNLVLDEKDIASERQVVQEERRMRMDNSPFGPAGEAAQRLLFWVHPYGIPPIGYPHQIDAYTKEALLKHYQDFYVPNNVILVVAGDVKMRDVLPLAEKYFGGLESRPVPERKRPTEPSHEGVALEMSYSKPRINLTELNWFYTAPNHLSKHSDLFYPLIVLDQILGGSTISRLYRVLVEEKRLAVSTGTNYPLTTLDPQPFSISVVLSPEATLSHLKEALQSELDRLAKDGVTEEELANAKRDILANLTFSMDDVRGLTSYFEHLAHKVTVDDIEAYPDHIKAVTKEQVHTAARAILGANPILRMTFYPQTTKEIDPKTSGSGVNKNRNQG